MKEQWRWVEEKNRETRKLFVLVWRHNAIDCSSAVPTPPHLSLSSDNDGGWNAC